MNKILTALFLGVGYGGGGVGADNGALNGLIAELIVYDTALNPEQRQQVAYTLADKYGLSVPEPGVMALIFTAGVLLYRKWRS